MHASRIPDLSAYILSNSNMPIRLHLGCGGMRWKDFINVDLHPHDPKIQDKSRCGCAADVVADIRNLGLPDQSVDEIFASHVIDHFTRWVCIDMLRDWHRMLKVQGTLVIEVADFWRCVLWLFHPCRKNRELAKSQFYGNQQDCLDYETHRYVWSAEELKHTLLKDIGFQCVDVNHRTQTHYPGRDMRIVAIK